MLESSWCRLPQRFLKTWDKMWDLTPWSPQRKIWKFDHLTFPVYLAISTCWWKPCDMTKKLQNRARKYINITLLSWYKTTCCPRFWIPSYCDYVCPNLMFSWRKHQVGSFLLVLFIVYIMLLWFLVCLFFSLKGLFRPGALFVHDTIIKLIIMIIFIILWYKYHLFLFWKAALMWYHFLNLFQYLS